MHKQRDRGILNMFIEKLNEQDIVEFAFIINKAQIKLIRNLKAENITLKKYANNGELDKIKVAVKDKFNFVITDFDVKVSFNQASKYNDFKIESLSPQKMWLKFMFEKFGREYRAEYKKILAKQLFAKVEDDLYQDMKKTFGAPEDETEYSL